MTRFLQVVWLGLALTALGGETSPLSTTEAQEGKRLYVLKCAKCHKFYDPKQYSDQDWAEWMGKMARKSRLKKNQEELVSKYADELRKPR